MRPLQFFDEEYPAASHALADDAKKVYGRDDRAGFCPDQHIAIGDIRRLDVHEKNAWMLRSPVHVKLNGWSTSAADTRTLADLPGPARAYLDHIESLAERRPAT